MAVNGLMTVKYNIYFSVIRCTFGNKWVWPCERKGAAHVSAVMIVRTEFIPKRYEFRLISIVI